MRRSLGQNPAKSPPEAERALETARPRTGDFFRRKGAISIALGATGILAAGFGSAHSAAADAASGPLSPQQERESFKFADEQLTADLVAAEPDVTSPVAVAWDAHGRMFVAEMSDYPDLPEKGRIKLLEDQDGDGRCERTTVFADDLRFPNGILPWREGVLVTAAPDIWFLKDTNADGVADERRKILTGFAEGNPQLRVNGLFLGIDGWIYGANGRSQGDVRWADPAGASEKAISIRGRDFRFRPDMRQFEAIAGHSQFGAARDDWGNRFLSWNTIAVRHEVLPERYLARTPFLAETESVADITEPGDDGRIYPLTPAPLTFNRESTAHFNALAGLVIYRGHALGESYRGNAFVGESLRNLVHRRVLEPRGPTFSARRVEPDREFLASNDPWFHPVNFATGPDGALYVVDFYRRFVEHPSYVPEAMRGKIPWRTGAEHGRIWRLRTKRFQPDNSRNKLAAASTETLVKALEDDNGWRHDTAQRLLVERNDAAGKATLERLIRESTHIAARVRALHTLACMGGLPGPLLKTLIADAQARVREHAILLSGEFLAQQSDEELTKSLFRAVDDSDARVRFQVGLAIGELSNAAKFEALARLAQRDFADRWQSSAILSGLDKSPWLFLKSLIAKNDAWLQSPTVEQARFLDRVARLVGVNHDEGELAESLALIGSLRAAHRLAHFTLLAGLSDGLARAGQPLDHLLSEPPNHLREPLHLIRDSVRESGAAAVEPRADATSRSAALRVAVHGKSKSAAAAVLQLLQPDEAAELQTAAVRAFADLQDAELAKTVFEGWNRYSTATRRQLLAASLRGSCTTAALIDGLERETVRSVELDASTREGLQKIQDPSIKLRVAKMFKSSASNRGEVVRQFQPALKLEGDRKRGAAIFARSCLVCHAIDTQHIGPPLSSLASRPPEMLMVDIFDPSQPVSPDFVNYTVVTTEGAAVSGLIAAETATSITLRRPAQPDETVLRNQIKEFRAEGKSIMPDGLEAGLTLQDFADLLKFVQQPEAELLPR